MIRIYRFKAGYKLHIMETCYPFYVTPLLVGQEGNVTAFRSLPYREQLFPGLLEQELIDW